ncbi:hypothetical protein HDU91_005143 [Kappamyces sp. JEL0680]|nr:hypothetical protein HDU91_005143 [Kappamyces sp. JEL0680]
MTFLIQSTTLDDIPSSTEHLLEGTLNMVLPSDQPLPKPAEILALVLHPYPPLGGNKDNHVVRFVCNLLNESFGIASLALNMRGAGASQGRCSWTGSTETNDIVQVCVWVREMLQKDFGWVRPRLLLVGYSYGSIIGLNAAPEMEDLVGVISISYPSLVVWALTMFQTQSIINNLSKIPAAIPKLLLLGANDNFSSTEHWQGFLKAIPDPKEFHVLEPSVDHFYTTSSSLDLLLARIETWLVENFADYTSKPLCANGRFESPEEVESTLGHNNGS